MYILNEHPAAMAKLKGHADYPEDFPHLKDGEDFAAWRVGDDWHIESTLVGEELKARLDELEKPLGDGGEKTFVSLNCSLYPSQLKALQSVCEQMGIPLEVVEEDKEDVVVIINLTRVRACEGEHWSDTLYLTIPWALYEKYYPSAWSSEVFVSNFLKERIAEYLTTKEGWASICNACRDYNWGDFVMDLPLPEFGISYDSKEVLGLRHVETCDLLVNQDELIAPAQVGAEWALRRENGTSETHSAIVNFQDGRIDVPTAPDDFSNIVSGTILLRKKDYAVVLECDPDEDYQRLKSI